MLNLLWVFLSSLVFTSLSLSPIKTDSSLPQVAGIVSFINQDRVLPLRQNTFLDQTATKRACDMYRDNTWSHDGYTKYIWGAGYKGYYVGENLARYYDNDWEVYNAWKNSPTHYRVMTSLKFRQIGVGHCGTYTVAHFGS